MPPSQGRGATGPDRRGQGILRHVEGRSGHTPARWPHGSHPFLEGRGGQKVRSKNILLEFNESNNRSIALTDGIQSPHVERRASENDPGRQEPNSSKSDSPLQQFSMILRKNNFVENVEKEIVRTGGFARFLYLAQNEMVTTGEILVCFAPEKSPLPSKSVKNLIYSQNERE